MTGLKELQYKAPTLLADRVAWGINDMKKVLVVDDEQSLLRLLAIRLRLSGYDVITAINGSEALELIENERPDLVLLDIIMPVVDGFEVLEIMRDWCTAPVIAMSAREENADRAWELGAREFVSKPFDVDELVGTIQRILAG